MDLVNSPLVMANLMKDFITTIKSMAMEYFLGLMESAMKAGGLKENKMVMEFSTIKQRRPLLFGMLVKERKFLLKK